MTTASLSASFTRPNDTNAYQSGDLVANNTSAGSVVPLSFGSIGTWAGTTGVITRAQIRKSGTGVTNPVFRLHIYQMAAPGPVAANGDNAAWSTTGAAGYLGYCDIAGMVAFTDGAVGDAATVIAPGFVVNPSAGPLWGYIEARGAYAPAANEVFTAKIDIQSAGY